MFKELHIELTKKPSWKRTNERRVKSEAAVSWVNFYYEFYYANSSHRERKTAEEIEANCVSFTDFITIFELLCFTNPLRNVCKNTQTGEKESCKKTDKKRIKNGPNPPKTIRYFSFDACAQTLADNNNNSNGKSVRRTRTNDEESIK